jgi:hypothetical protein
MTLSIPLKEIDCQLNALVDRTLAVVVGCKLAS